MDCSPPGFSVHGIFQARILEWVVIFLLQGIFLTQGLNPGIRTRLSFPLSQSLPSGSFHKPLILLHQREDKQNLVCTRTQEKGAVTPQETNPDTAMSVQDSPAEGWGVSGPLQGGLLQAALGRHRAQQCIMGPFEPPVAATTHSNVCLSTFDGSRCAYHGDHG